jgi:hypothetical protein
VLVLEQQLLPLSCGSVLSIGGYLPAPSYYNIEARGATNFTAIFSLAKNTVDFSTNIRPIHTLLCEGDMDESLMTVSFPSIDFHELPGNHCKNVPKPWGSRKTKRDSLSFEPSIWSSTSASSTMGFMWWFATPSSDFFGDFFQCLTGLYPTRSQVSQHQQSNRSDAMRFLHFEQLVLTKANLYQMGYGASFIFFFLLPGFQLVLFFGGKHHHGQPPSSEDSPLRVLNSSCFQACSLSCSLAGSITKDNRHAKIILYAC